MAPKTTSLVYRNITQCLKEMRESLELQLPFDDPNITILNTINADSIFDTGLIKSNYTKAKIRSVIDEYIKKYIETRYRRPESNNLFDTLRKDSGMTEGSQTETKEPEQRPRSSHEDELNSPMTQEEEPHDQNDPPNEDFEDEISPDPISTSQSIKFPALPRTPCPQTLFIGTLRYKYMNSLFTTDRTAFPKQWNRMKNSDPENAWHSLNQTMIPFINKRWEKQGVVIGMTETPVDYLCYSDLKASILQTLRESKNENATALSSKSTPSNAPPINSDIGLRFERNLGRLEEAIRVITSHATKTTGREVSLPAAPCITQPYLAGSSVSVSVSVFGFINIPNKK